MRYKATLIGFLLGLFTRRPHLIVLAMMLGFALDMGWLQRLLGRKPAPSHPDGPQRSPYEVLDVPETADNDAIEAAYRRQMAQYHPDKVDGAAPEIRALAEKRAVEINAAYDALRKERGF